jgi:hypothetical protein
MLNDLIEEQLAKEPNEQKKRRVAFRDPLAKYPLGKIEIQDREEDSPVGRMLTKNDWRFF